MEKTTSVRRMPAEELSTLLLSPEATKVAVIDVRGDDHVGGHIHKSTHAPSSTLDHRMPELVRTLADKEIVVFHCALSQERGPRAARWYAEERQSKLKKGEVDTGSSIGIKEGEVQKIPNRESKEQEVYVLDKGFVGWQEKYGKDVRLTEAYAPDIWTDY